MSVEVYKNLFVGDLQDCVVAKEFAIVHACKSPCHQKAVGYTKNLHQNHPNYLIKEEKDNLYLNLVDRSKIDPKYTDEPIKTSMLFVDKYLNQNKKVLIHCNLGQSRSCAIAMIYLAKKGIINMNDFKHAFFDFKLLYPNVSLGIGFNNYLNTNWSNLMKL